ncbi:hypothetical protein [Staphylococcus saprophyticus]|uniref:hypothetical protein n=1 Tax=Staphylococcus saprophyticus TaxID=29385 RepID=UPI001642FAC0|nr:hypothetical protein [Staphylococcus saprophyticus]MBC2921951.1 hypothetical protein [Staphylococcus saprophyticus]MBC2958526.1 hypothetical protein [Staphylococcus saprophyticus]MBC3010391.1 hypothetical protein [Staphylococcus saprophyticus]MBC3024270.1 hypothetical protein [Staphylococcus saprophyticus]MBC3031497.1 hypothetical protein [Staphylococcus saprophyticus]
MDSINESNEYFSMKKFIGNASDVNINVLIAIVITIYLIIRSMVTQDYVYLLNYSDINKTLSVLGNNLNDMILAYIPIGAFLFTLDGSRLESGSIKERLYVAIGSLVAIPIYIGIVYIGLWFIDLLYKDSGSLTALMQSLLDTPIRFLLLILVVSFIYIFLSMAVGNIMISLFIFLKNINKNRNTISIEEDIYVDNNYTNIYNFWYRYNYNPTLNIRKYVRDIYFVKVYIKSHKENKVILNIYNAEEKLVKAKKETQIKVTNNMREVELENKLKPTVKNVVENYKKTKQS